MKKLFLLFVVSFFFLEQNSFAQLVLPEVGSIEKQEIFSSKEEESTPLSFNNGNSIFYNKTYTEGDGENTIVVSQEIRYSTIGKKGWDKPYRLLREDDLPGENLIVGTNKTGSRIYVFNAFPEKDTLIRKLYYLDKAEEKYKWSAPTEIIIPGLEIGNEFVHFYVNRAETAILISKPPRVKANDEDLFVSVKAANGNWGEPIDLGKKINTNRFELGSFISDDLKTIYFSSEGHGGYGAADIFVSKRLDETWQNWTKPMNMGEPINSIDYDAFFAMGDNNEFYFTSDRGDQHSSIYKGSLNGKIQIEVTDSIKGVFMKNGEYVSGVRISILNSENKVLSNVITDKDGSFAFKKLKGEDNYLVKIDEEDSDFVGSKIYFVNNDGEKTDRYVLTEDGLFVNSSDLASKETIQGVFNYNALPAAKTGLVVLDENGFPLDTLYTDENGNFSYSVLNLEGGISIVPLNMTEDEFINVDMYLVDANGVKFKTLKPREFHKLTKEDDTLVGSVDQQNTRTTGIDEEDYTGGKVEMAAIKNSSPDAYTIYFDFGKTIASAQELNKLSLIASFVKVTPGKSVLLIGYTDSIGEEGVNMEVGAARGGSIRAALIERGVSAKSITVISRGEDKPAASNKTAAGRAKNRRVKVILK